jgi:hypothetical protein
VRFHRKGFLDELDSFLFQMFIYLEMTARIAMERSSSFGKRSQTFNCFKKVGEKKRERKLQGVLEHLLDGIGMQARRYVGW